MEEQINVGEGKYEISAKAIITCNGLLVTLFGGERSHIGAVAIAIPRPSLRNPTERSVTSSIFTLVGHKDDEIAKPAAESISRELNQVTVVVAGVHVENASSDEIRLLVENSMKAIENLISKLSSLK